MIYHPELSNIQIPIPESCTIHSHVWIGRDVILGERIKIQAFAFIPSGVIIEDDAFIGPGVIFTNDKHPPSGGKWSRTIVKKGAVIGARAVILPGITIGKGAMIGAGAIITKDVPDGEIWISVAAQKK